MNQCSVALLLLILCCCWTIECNVITSEKRPRSYSTDQYMNCKQYVSDQDIINQIPFPISTGQTMSEEIESSYTMDVTGTSVVYLRLMETDATVPESIFCLKNLENLLIANMNFADGVVPDTLANLQQLTFLTIYNTTIVHMTDQLESLANLRSLALSYCSLTQLPNLNKLPYLYELDVSHNRLSKIPELNSIHRLFLDNNRLTEIPSTKVPEVLMYLFIGSNPLKHWEALNSFVDLQYLSLDNANMSSIPSSVSRLQRLHELDLSGNQLSSMPRYMFELPELYILRINNNLFSADQIEKMQREFEQVLPALYLEA